MAVRVISPASLARVPTSVRRRISRLSRSSVDRSAAETDGWSSRQPSSPHNCAEGVEPERCAASCVALFVWVERTMLELVMKQA
jgi:hypothetical protein